jgi:hypothetical protein
MIPSSEQVAENIRKVIDGLANEIAQRVADDPRNSDGTPYGVKLHAKTVLLDWFLGELLPGNPTNEKEK